MFTQWQNCTEQGYKKASYTRMVLRRVSIFQYLDEKCSLTKAKIKKCTKQSGG